MEGNNKTTTTTTTTTSNAGDSKQRPAAPPQGTGADPKQLEGDNKGGKNSELKYKDADADAIIACSPRRRGDPTSSERLHVKISDIIPYERNARHNKKAIPAVADSIRSLVYVAKLS